MVSLLYAITFIPFVYISADCDNTIAHIYRLLCKRHWAEVS
jgi:hypothetical protein